MVNSFRELIQELGGPAAFGRAVGMLPNAAKQANRRDSLSPRYFGAAVKAAQDRKIPGVTLRRLVEISEQRRLAGPPDRRREAHAEPVQDAA